MYKSHTSYSYVDISEQGETPRLVQREIQCPYTHRPPWILTQKFRTCIRLFQLRNIQQEFLVLWAIGSRGEIRRQILLWLGARKLDCKPVYRSLSTCPNPHLSMVIIWPCKTLSKNFAIKIATTIIFCCISRELI